MIRWPVQPLGRLRQEEYTGANRCVLCTLVNVILAVVLILGVVVLFDGFLSSIALVVVISVVSILFTGAILLRGYLVPGTPALTKAMFPDWLLRWFEGGKTVGKGDSTEEFDIEKGVKAMDAVAECEDGDDLCLTDDFHERWKSQITRVRADDPSREVLSTMLGINGDSLEFDEYGEATVVSHAGREVGRWESQAALVADVAAAKELRRRSAHWASLDIRHRGLVLHHLRIFLEECPLCRGPVSVNREVTESCCRSLDVLAMTCEECGVRVLEAEQ